VAVPNLPLCSLCSLLHGSDAAHRAPSDRCDAAVQRTAIGCRMNPPNPLMDTIDPFCLAESVFGAATLLRVHVR
jgi:hypothetical protein